MENCFVCDFYFYAIKDENQPNAASNNSNALADSASILDSSVVGNFCESMDIYPLPEGISDDETLSLCHRCSIATSKILLLQEQINHLQNQVSQLQYSVAEKALLSYYNNIDEIQHQDPAILAAEEASTIGVVRKLLRDRWEEREDEVPEKQEVMFPKTGLTKKEEIKKDEDDKKHTSAALRPSASSIVQDMKKKSANAIYQPNALYVKQESGAFSMASVFNSDYNTTASDHEDYEDEIPNAINLPGGNCSGTTENEDTEEYGIEGEEGTNGNGWELEGSGGDSNEGIMEMEFTEEYQEGDDNSNDIIIEEVKSTAPPLQNNVLRLLTPGVLPPKNILNQRSSSSQSIRLPSYAEGVTLLPIGKQRTLLPKPPTLLMPTLRPQQTTPNFRRSKQSGNSSSNSPNRKVRTCPFENCGKEFSNADRYTEHINVHNGNAPSCPICKKVFPRKYNLRIHMRTHTGEKPHRCPICSQKYADKSNLNAHIRKHYEKPFHCSICQRMFDDITSSQAHVLTFHPERKERNLIRLTRLVKAGNNV